MTAQKTDAMMLGMMQDGQWFWLENEFDNLQRGCEDDNVKNLTRAQLAFRFNRYDVAIDLLGHLVREGGEYLSADDGLSYTLQAVQACQRVGDYKKSYEFAQLAMDRYGKRHEDYLRKTLFSLYEQSRVASQWPSREFEWTSKAQEVTVPFSFNLQDDYWPTSADDLKAIPGRYYLPVRCNGKDIKMMFDSGGPVTYISRRMAERIGAKIVEGESDFPLALIDSLSIGNGIVWRNVVAEMRSQGPLADYCALDAVIGMDLMVQLAKIMIDNRKHTFTLSREGSKDSKPSNLLFNEAGWTHVYGEFDHTAYSLLLDSGGESTMFTPGFYRRHKDKWPADLPTKEYGTSSIFGNDTCKAICPPDVEIKSYDQTFKLTRPNINIKSRERDKIGGSICIDYLSKQKRITFDFVNMRFTVE